MATYTDHLTLQCRILTQADYDAGGGHITNSRGDPTAFVVGDWLVKKQVGGHQDIWVEPQATFATSGWFPVTPPDGQGFCQYRGPRVVTVTDTDDGYFSCSSGCRDDYATFYASHTLNPES